MWLSRVKGDCGQHDVARQYMQAHHQRIGKPLVVSQKTGDKGCGHNCQNDVIRCGGNVFYLGLRESSYQEIDGAKNDDDSHDIGESVGKGPPADGEGFIPKTTWESRKIGVTINRYGMRK
jgi:hypothetical protein